MQMNLAGERGLTVGGLLADDLLRSYFPSGFPNHILAQQLADRELCERNLSELAEMDAEELTTLAFVRTLENAGEGEASPRAESAAEAEKAPAPGAGVAGGVSVLVEGLGVEAKVVLNEPGEGGRPPTEADIRRALADCGVVRGIRSNFIERLAQRPIYGRKFKIAQGALPVDGEDGRVIFHFDTSSDLTPRINEAGIADYKSLDFAKSVKKGDVLCEIIPPTLGTDGFGVHGETLPGSPGKPAEVVSGPNTVFSEDRRAILAACDGQVKLKGNKVVVSRVLMVDQVDASTGNILFVGTVQVRGDVAAGFTVRAGGDIVVKGIVESATLVAGGNIVLCSGVKGQDAGLIDAGRNVRTFFIENGHVRAKENIYADVILNSTIECGQTVNLSGENGCLLGGRCTAGKGVRAIQIGNKVHIPTVVVLKNMDAIFPSRAKAETQIARHRETVVNLRQIAALASGNGTDEASFQVMLARLAITKQRLEGEIRRLQAGLSGGEPARVSRAVVVREELYPNTTIEIDGISYLNTQRRTGCAVTNLKGEIRLQSDRYY